MTSSLRINAAQMPQMAQIESKKSFPMLERSFELSRATFDKAKRTVRVQFASEAPVKRWFGNEILDCSPECVDLSRVNAGAAVLMEHDTAMRCGITESGNVTGAGTVEAEVRFARNAVGDGCMAEVEDGTLRWISVGYRVDKFQVDEETEEYRAIRWTPLEVSFVAIPADPTARVLRSNQTESEVTMFTRSRQLAPAATETAGGTTPAAPAIVTKEDFSRMVDEALEICALGNYWQRTHPAVTELVEKSLKDKTSLVDFQRSLMECIKTPAREDISAPAIGEGQARQYRGRKSFGERFVESTRYKEASARRNWKGNHFAIEIPDEYQFRADTGMSTLR